jgi:cytoskeletal protein CcmA (bactofilin family)
MLGKETKFRPEEAETIIGEGVKVDGIFNAFGNVVIKGELTGSLATENDLSVQEKGRVEANIKAKNATISGEIKGNMGVEEKVELSATARVLGDINCRVLAINEGATLNGRCKVGEGSFRDKKNKLKETKEEEILE